MLGNLPLPLHPLQGSSTIAVPEWPPTTRILGIRTTPAPLHCRQTISIPATVITPEGSLHGRHMLHTRPGRSPWSSFH